MTKGKIILLCLIVSVNLTQSYCHGDAVIDSKIRSHLAP
jgi:hypothetical protein